MFLPRASKIIVPKISFLSKFTAELKVNNRITHLNGFLSEQLNFFFKFLKLVTKLQDSMVQYHFIHIKFIL